MVKILMHGCNGHMGQVIARLAASDSETEIIAGVDVSDHITNPYPVFKSLEDYRQAWEKDESLKADVVIDFLPLQRRISCWIIARLCRCLSYYALRDLLRSSWNV